MGATLIGTDWIYTGVCFNDPALIACEVAVLGCVEYLSKASDKSSSRDRIFIRSLVTACRIERVNDGLVKSLSLWDILISPGVAIPIDGQFFKGKVPIRCYLSAMHLFNQNVPVNLVIFVDLVGHDVVNFWRVWSPVDQHTLVCVHIFANNWPNILVYVYHTRHDGDILASITRWKQARAIEVVKVGIENLHHRWRGEGKFTLRWYREELIVATKGYPMRDKLSRLLLVEPVAVLHVVRPAVFVQTAVCAE